MITSPSSSPITSSIASFHLNLPSTQSTTEAHSTKESQCEDEKEISDSGDLATPIALHRLDSKGKRPMEEDGICEYPPSLTFPEDGSSLGHEKSSYDAPEKRPRYAHDRLGEGNMISLSFEPSISSAQLFPPITAQSYTGRTLCFPRRSPSSADPSSCSVTPTVSRYQSRLSSGRSIYRLMDQIEGEIRLEKEQQSLKETHALLSSLRPSTMDTEEDATDKSRDGELWVDKYAPKHFTDLISNATLNKAILQWIKEWDRCVFGEKYTKSRRASARLPGKDHPFSETTMERDRLGRPHRRVCRSMSRGKGRNLSHKTPLIISSYLTLFFCFFFSIDPSPSRASRCWKDHIGAHCSQACWI